MHLQLFGLHVTFKSGKHRLLGTDSITFTMKPDTEHLVLSRYVALKVCCGVDKPTFSRETNILHALQQSDRAHAGFDNILTLYEAFIISGPNGFHECLVTEVVAPLFGIGIKGGWSKKDILRQIAAAVLLLHSKGLAHGGK